MAKVYDFEQARADKDIQTPYVTSEEITIPEFVQEVIDDQRARHRRELLRVAAVLIDSGDVPVAREPAEDEMLPRFDDPSTSKT